MKKIIRLTESDLTRLVRRVIIESKKNPVYDEALCDAVLNADLNSENNTIKWYDNIKDVEDHSWFFNSPDPRIKKHLDYINTSCDGDPKKIKSKTVWWWYSLANAWCSSMDDDYGRYNRELDRDPNLFRSSCQTSEKIQNDNIKYPRRDGF